MIELNPMSNLLEQDPYEYELQDIPEAQLFRDIYPYDEIPKTPFNHRRVPMNMPRDIWITDTLLPFISSRRAWEKEVSALFVALYIAKYGIG